MQIEPYTGDDGYRVWLSTNEQQLLNEHFSEEPRKQFAVELMLDGLRSDEVTRVSRENFRRLDADDEAYELRIREGKTEYREAPVSNETRQKAIMLAHARNFRKDEELIDVTTRTIQWWVDAAADSACSYGNA